MAITKKIERDLGRVLDPNYHRRIFDMYSGGLQEAIRAGGNPADAVKRVVNRTYQTVVADLRRMVSPPASGLALLDNILQESGVPQRPQIPEITAGSPATTAAAGYADRNAALISHADDRAAMTRRAAELLANRDSERERETREFTEVMSERVRVPGGDGDITRQDRLGPRPTEFTADIRRGDEGRLSPDPRPTADELLIPQADIKDAPFYERSSKL